jgi:D-alanine-D-alanine ligase
MSRVRVCVLFGGRSSEHEISCVSAGGILAALDPLRYEVIAVGITKSGRWTLFEGDASVLAIVKGKLPEVLEGGVPVQLAINPASPGLMVGGEFIDLDVVFPVLHGPWGEDGTVQGLLELAGVPYVGSGVLASAAAMDKPITKTLLAAAGLETGSWVEVPVGEPAAAAAARVVATLSLPVFVKPARAGSSRGITKAVTESDVVSAIEEARQHDPKVIVEAAVVGAREIECGVMVDSAGQPQASTCAEIKVAPGFDYYDFDAKYLSDGAELIVPAAMSDEEMAVVQREAVRAFVALGCEGLARVDFFLTNDNGLIVNEVNTMPGFTPISMFPQMFQASGLSYPEIVDALIADALRRGSGLRPSP